MNKTKIILFEPEFIVLIKLKYLTHFLFKRNVRLFKKKYDEEYLINLSIFIRFSFQI